MSGRDGDPAGAEPRPEQGERVREIPVGSIVPNPNQPRRVFDEEALEELAASIAQHGLMQPVVVREPGEAGSGRYELVAGERRWRAAQRAGQTTIPALVRRVDEAGSAQLALIENIQREDLNPIERARGYEALIDRFSMTQEDVARTVGTGRSSVANYLRLLDLDDATLELVSSGHLSVGHAKVLLGCPDPQIRAQLAKLASEEGWSVRVLEQRLGRIGSDAAGTDDKGGEQPAGTTRLQSVLHDLENRLGERLSTRVSLKTDRSGTKGRIVIEFYDLDHFDGLMGKLGVEESADFER